MSSGSWLIDVIAAGDGDGSGSQSGDDSCGDGLHGGLEKTSTSDSGDVPGPSPDATPVPAAGSSGLLAERTRLARGIVAEFARTMTLQACRRAVFREPGGAECEVSSATGRGVAGGAVLGVPRKSDRAAAGGTYRGVPS